MTLMTRQRGALASRLLGEDRAEDWRARAACRDADPDLFHALGDKWSKHDTPLIQAAKDICAGCSTVAECLADAAGDDHAIRAGMLPAERRAARLRQTRIRQRHCQRCRTEFWTARARYCSTQCRDEAARVMRSSREPILERTVA